MNCVKKIFAVMLCALTLFGCAEKPVERVSAPESVSVNIETYMQSEESSDFESSEISSETLPTASYTKAPEETTVREYKTDGTDTRETSANISEEDKDYEITPANGRMKATSDVNVRELPDADSDRAGHLDKGEKVEITGICSNGWIRIIYKGEEKFVNGRYLKSVSEAETTAEAVSETEKVTAAPQTEVKTETETEPAKTEEATKPTTAAAVTEPPETTPEPTEIEEITEITEITESTTVNGNLEIFTGSNPYRALNYSIQKAVWLAFLDIDDMIKDASEQQFRSKISEEYDSIKDLGCNTVYVHVRAYGDAYYYSDIFPFAASYSDVLGAAPSYDPLKIMIDEAHSRGLSFHAWINPMRTTSKERFAEMDGRYALKQWYDSDSANGTFLVYDKETKLWWLSPAYPAVRALICNGVSEIVSNYNVDGVHIDDYFYPTTSSSFDKAAFEASGEEDLSKWRLSVVSELVSELYSTVKACNGTVEFGVSPQGNMENNREKLYADIERWCREPGYLDYIVPQIYYGYNDKLSFETALEQWRGLSLSYGKRLICGIAAYKVGINSEWSEGDILKRQVDGAREKGYNGVAFYRSGSLFSSASSSPKIMKNSELPALKISLAGF